MRWECRYSSCEMMYLEVTETDVRCYLDPSVDNASHWTFEQVVQGAMDREVANLFTDEEIEEVKAMARERSNNLR